MRIAITGAPRTGKSTLAREMLTESWWEVQYGGPTGIRSIKDCPNPMRHAPIMCTDPIHLVKDPEPGVTYVPRDVYHLAKAAGQSGDDPGPDQPWSSSSWYVATQFLTRPGPLLIEGTGLPRALRKWLLIEFATGADPSPSARACVSMAVDWARWNEAQVPLDKLIVLRTPRAPQLPGQVAMGKGLLTVLEELRPWLGDRIEWR